MKSTFSYAIAGLLALLLSVLALPAKAATYQYIYDSSNPQNYTTVEDEIEKTYSTSDDSAKKLWENQIAILEQYARQEPRYSPVISGFSTAGTVTTYVASNPEPETLAMMAIGLAVVGWMAKRRNSKAALTGRTST